MEKLSVPIAAFVVAFSGLVGAANVSAAPTDALITEAEGQLKSGHFEQAISLLQEAVAQDHKSTVAYTRLGGALLMAGRYNESVRAFQEAVTADPTNSEAFGGMGISYVKMGWLGPAKAAFVEAGKLDPLKKKELQPVMARIETKLSHAQQATVRHP